MATCAACHRVTIVLYSAGMCRECQEAGFVPLDPIPAQLYGMSKATLTAIVAAAYNNPEYSQVLAQEALNKYRNGEQLSDESIEWLSSITELAYDIIFTYFQRYLQVVHREQKPKAD